MATGKKTALVTGGGSGIGRATALAFARTGYAVAVAGTTLSKLEETVAEIRALGAEGLAIETDVADPAACRAMVAETVRAFGRLDAAVNNAGVTEISLLGGEIPPESHLLPLDIWRRVLAVDLDGIFHAVQPQIAQMLDQGSGAIVNIGSMQSHVATARNPAYVAAKHGVVGLTKAIAREYGGRGIRCNTVSPGIVDTPLTTKVIHSDAFESALLGMIPAGRFAEGADIADAILWLCSDGARYVNGATLPVDGGFLS